MTASRDGARGLTSGHLLARNSLLNMVTSGSILLVSIVFVPLMLRSFGMELYGVLSVTWMVLGHLKFLDLGFSAACAKYVAQDLALGREDQAGLWAWTAIVVQALIGVCAAVLLWLGVPALVSVLGVAPETSPLVVLALRLFALVIPLDLATRSIIGVLEGAQRFDWTNGLNAFAAVWTYGTYTVGILRGGDFHAVVYGLVALKVVQLAAAFWVASRVIPSLSDFSRIGAHLRLDRLRVLEMLRFGGWVSVGTAIGPAILYFDRWVISTARGVAALPLYTVPWSLLWSLSVIPIGLSSTLFPAFSAMRASDSWERLEGFFVQAHRYLLMVLLPVLFVLFLWAPELLRIWISEEFAAQAVLPCRILIVGFAVGLFAPLSGVLLQGAGRPDLLSKVYLVELPFNVLLTIFLVRKYGIVGAALSYSLRTIVETFVLWIVIYRTFPLSWVRCLRGALQPTGWGVVALVAFGALLSGAQVDKPMAAAATAAAVCAYAWATLVFFLNESDRTFFRGLVRRVLGSAQPAAGPPPEGRVAG